MQQNAMENSGLRCWIKYCEKIMKPIEELMLNIKKDLKENLQLDANLSELPQNGGIYLEVGNVTEKNYIRNVQCKRTVLVLFMCKQADEPKAIETLEKSLSIPDKTRYIRYSYIAGCTFCVVH